MKIWKAGQEATILFVSVEWALSVRLRITADVHCNVSKTRLVAVKNIYFRIWCVHRYLSDIGHITTEGMWKRMHLYILYIYKPSHFRKGTPKKLTTQLKRNFYVETSSRRKIYVLITSCASRADVCRQATGLDAWASRVKCPARFVSHLHDICIYMSCS